MPLNLVQRAGEDTLGKLEQAARFRFREAERLLKAGEQLGAIYLYGYTIEIRLKAAYFRTVGLVAASRLDAARHTAEAAIRRTHPGRPAVGHYIIGWARLLEQARANVGRPMPADLSRVMHGHAQSVFRCWAEFLRYRANKPYNDEIDAVAGAARWFRRNATALWS